MRALHCSKVWEQCWFSKVPLKTETLRLSWFDCLVDWLLFEWKLHSPTDTWVICQWKKHNRNLLILKLVEIKIHSGYVNFERNCERKVSDTDGNFYRSRQVSSCWVSRLIVELENRLEQICVDDKRSGLQWKIKRAGNCFKTDFENRKKAATCWYFKTVSI